jgi:hypothetical protein
MELKRREFENLKQNDSPVMRYVREFSVVGGMTPGRVKRLERYKDYDWLYAG